MKKQQRAKTDALPIIFQPEMVRAFLNNQKKVTRRTTGFDPINLQPTRWKFAGFEGDGGQLFAHMVYHHTARGKPEDYLVKFPWHNINKRLWVRERCLYNDAAKVVRYDLADDADTLNYYIGNGWKRSSSIHMPQWASRVTLRIVSVDVWRLGQMNGYDAQDEGAQKRKDARGNWTMGDLDWIEEPTPMQAFIKYWERLHGHYDREKWTWAIGLKVI